MNHAFDPIDRKYFSHFQTFVNWKQLTKKFSQKKN
jgi:hypothetical protein